MLHRFILLAILLPAVIVSSEGLFNFKNGFPSVTKLLSSMGKMMNDLFPCGYSCPNGGYPTAKLGYKATPNGCGSIDTTMFARDLASYVPQVEQCCNVHDECYGTCSSGKGQCDGAFRECLRGVCTTAKQLIKAVGGKFDVSEMCEAAITGVTAVVQTGGCPAYRSAQEAACVCASGPNEL